MKRPRKIAGGSSRRPSEYHGSLPRSDSRSAMPLLVREEPFFGSTGSASASSMYRRTAAPPSVLASCPFGRSTLSRCSRALWPPRQPSAIPSDSTGRRNLGEMEYFLTSSAVSTKNLLRPVLIPPSSRPSPPSDVAGTGRRGTAPAKWTNQLPGRIDPCGLLATTCRGHSSSARGLVIAAKGARWPRPGRAFVRSVTTVLTSASSNTLKVGRSRASILQLSSMARCSCSP